MESIFVYIVKTLKAIIDGGGAVGSLWWVRGKATCLTCLEMFWKIVIVIYILNRFDFERFRLVYSQTLPGSMFPWYRQTWANAHLNLGPGRDPNNGRWNSRVLRSGWLTHSKHGPEELGRGDRFLQHPGTIIISIIAIIIIINNRHNKNYENECLL